MTESKVEYDAGEAMRQITENYVAQLERTIDGYNMIQHRHAEMIAERDARIAELTDALERKNGALHALDGIAKQLAETVSRLEAEAQQRLDYTPVTLLRYIVNSHPNLPVDDRITAHRWLDSLDGDA